MTRFGVRSCMCPRISIKVARQLVRGSMLRLRSVGMMTKVVAMDADMKERDQMFKDMHR